MLGFMGILFAVAALWDMASTIIFIRFWWARCWRKRGPTVFGRAGRK